MSYTNPSWWVMIYFYAKVSFFDNLMKSLDSGWSSVPFPKIKTDPSQQGKNALVFIF